ncbi:MAG: extracellular solute-binding protein, partial [Thermofilum sp.]|nr:extracellular solute-binding protein [Thermofilum sp.]
MSQKQDYVKYAVIAIAIVIVIAGLYFFFANPPAQSPAQQQPSQPTQPTQQPTQQQPAQQQPSQPVLLKGSGATFPEAQLRKWIQVFTSTNTDIKIEYSAVGSGQGVSDFLNGLTTFGCSDVPLTTDQLNQAKNKYGTVYQVPYLLGGIAVVYNVPELKDKQPLKLTPEVLVDILLGKINYWDDPKIKELNPELADILP